jgi:hypothetical protein
MASKPGSQGLRVLTLIGMLVLSGACFYDAYDALSTGSTKAPGRNNNHYVTLAMGIASYFFGGSKGAPGDDEE